MTRPLIWCRLQLRCPIRWLSKRSSLFWNGTSAGLFAVCPAESANPALERPQCEEGGFILEFVAGTRHSVWIVEGGCTTSIILAGSTPAGVVGMASIESAAVALPHPFCTRKTFVKRLPNLTHFYVLQADRLREIIRSVGFPTGALPGSCLLTRLSIAPVRTPCCGGINVVAGADLGPGPIRSLGFDDYAWRKAKLRRSCWWILEIHSVVDLLPARSA